MKITGITKEMHGFADLSYVPLTLLAPGLAGFEADKASARICRAFSITALGYSLLTDAKWGAFKIIPYRVHAALDLSSGVLALAAAFIPPVSHNKRARKTLLLMGLTGLIVGSLSLIGARKK